jgi:hypothetical protein
LREAHCVTGFFFTIFRAKSRQVDSGYLDPAFAFAKPLSMVFRQSRWLPGPSMQGQQLELKATAARSIVYPASPSRGFDDAHSRT